MEIFRVNRPTLEDIKYINKILIALEDIIPSRTTKFIFPINKDREGLNDFAFRRIAATHQNLEKKVRLIFL